MTKAMAEAQNLTDRYGMQQEVLSQLPEDYVYKLGEYFNRFDLLSIEGMLHAETVARWWNEGDANAIKRFHDAFATEIAEVLKAIRVFEVNPLVEIMEGYYVNGKA
jgi:hypothetical protein